MRNLKIALLAIGTIVSLISLKDKAMVNTVPDAKPPVAEAYHSPQAMLPPLSIGPSAAPQPVIKAQTPVLNSASSPVDFAEKDPFSDNPIEVPLNSASVNLQALDTPVSAATPATTNSKQSETTPAATIIYGMTGTVTSPDTTDNNSGTGAGGNDSASSPTDTGGSNSAGTLTDTNANTETSQVGVFITGLTPNSGIPGTNIIVQGAGFNTTSSNNIVKFGSIDAGSVQYISNNQLCAAVPQGLSAGFTDLSVSVNGAISNTFLFDVLKNTSGNVFMDDTQNALPGGPNLTDASIVRMGDVDSDKDLDMLVIDTAGGSAYLLINNGQGIFTNETSSSLPAMVNISLITSAVFKDVNGDNYPDMILTYSGGQSVRLLLNNGHGKFDDVTTTNLPAVSGNAVSMDAGDANGDGIPDIIIANKNTKDALLINNGSGVFTVDTNFNLPDVIDGSSDIRFCDVNGDGSLDIITANNEVVGASSLRNRVYINNDQGQFTDNTESVLPEDNEYSEVLDYGDIDGDGDTDIIVANYNQNSILVNNGNGTFADETTARIPTNYFASKDTKLGDINGDGYPDIAMLGEDKMSLLINDWQGSFTEDSIKLPDYKSTPALVGGKNVQVADINGDGSLDIIIGGSSLRVLVNSASNKAPVLDHIGNKSIEFGKNLTFNVNGSDPNGDALTFLAEGLPGGATFLSKMFSWVPTANDIGQPKNIRFIAREDTQAALEAFEDITITVTGLPPVIDGYIPEELNLDLTLGEITQFGIIAHDPAGGALTFRWFLNSVEAPSKGGFSSSLMFVVPRLGENIIEARAENSTGSASIYWHVNVGVAQNRPPEITGYDPQESVVNIDLATGGAVSFAVTASDPDLSDTLSYAWKFDNTALPSSGANLSSSAFASPASVGDHTLQVSVSDGHNTAVTHSWTIRLTQGVTNNAPVAQNDTAVTNINTSIDIDVLANDSDIDGNPVSISTIETNPSHGTASIVSGKVRYTPNTTYTGSDSFTYKVSDGSLLSGAATVSVTVNAVNSEEILNDIINHSFNYFWNETDNPATGFVRDRLLVNGDPATDAYYEKASMAATGFGLAALCVAAEKYGDGTNPDWQTTPQDLAARAELILDTLLRIQASQASAGDATWGKSGFFYHFVNINTGENWPNVEVSSIDTAILVAGALTAGEYFKDTNQNISEKAKQLYANVDWNSFVDYTSEDHYGQFYKQWMPNGSGFNNGHWDYNDESMLLYLLAIGSPVEGHAVSPDLYYSIRRELGSYGVNGKPIVHTWFGSLFAYQYVNAFFELSNMHDARNVDWWQDAIDATKANRQFCIDQGSAGDYGYNEYVWGLSSAYEVGAVYKGEYGAPPAGSTNGPTHDGTVNPNVVASAIGMLPAEVGETLAYMKSDQNLWRQDAYGFVDSFKNSDPRVYSDYFVGLDLGAALVMAANHTDSGLIWNNFMNAATRYGSMRDLLANLNFHPNSDSALYIDVDDITAKSQFAYGFMSSDKTTSQISFNLTNVTPNSKYMLAVHTFMNDFAGNYQATIDVSVNGRSEGNQVFSHTENQPDEIKYIEIDSSNLQPGENTITLTWQDGASWVAWHNIEVSTPIANNEWNIIKSAYANEYRIDDTYYTGHASKYGDTAYKTFEKALNILTDPYTDILFYIDDLTHDRNLTLTTYSSGGDTSVNVTVNGQPSETDTGLSAQQPKQVVIPANRLKEGWNCIRLVIKAPASGWLIWDSLKLELGNPVSIEAPKGLASASFGRDKANLRWNSVSGADIRYNIYRSQTTGGPYVKVNSSPIGFAQYQDTSLVNNTTYYYVITAFEESAPTSESPYSTEVSVATGPYQLDYRDGRDPNIFGGYTLDNTGAPLGNNAFAELQRYNGTIGKVRKFVLSPGTKNTIDFNNANINNATMLSFRVKGGYGGEKFQVKFKDNSGGQSSISLEIPAGGVWQEMHFYMASDFSGLDLANVQNMEVISQTPGSQITFYLDEVEFATIDIAGDKLNVKIRNGADDSLATGVDFGTATAENSCVLSNQYVEIDYVSSGSWGIQIFTDNKAQDAYPRFTGSGDRANGLVGAANSGYRVPILWQVWQEKKGYYSGAETPQFDTTVDDGDRAEFAFVVDKSDSDWSVPYAQNYRTLIDHDGLLGAPVPLASPPPGYWPRQGKAGQAIYVYLAADFKDVPAQQYTTNKLTIDIYHE